MIQRLLQDGWENWAEVEGMKQLLLSLGSIPPEERHNYRVLSDWDSRYPFSKEDFDNDRWA
jgi:hypothetical protein